MRKLLFIMALVGLLGAAVAEGRFMHSSETSSAGQTRRDLTVVVDSVMWRSDVTRVYCRALGQPHTSHRIDSVAMLLPSVVAPVMAADIDPIYFRRGFQWEDDGVILLEIDFKAMNPARRFTLSFATPYGEYSAEYPAK